jgi:Ca-activated chloride channel family protein
MEGEKILHARHAAVSFLRTLADGDLVSIYTFADDATEIAPPTVIDAQSRGFLSDAIERIQANGGTNMYAGVTAGQARMAQATAQHPVRRLVVISDGQANIGPHAPADFERIAVQGTEHGAQISSIGVGTDYDENTLAALTLRSAGRMYHLGDPSEMARILDEELNLLALTVATNALVSVTPAPGVELLGLAVGEANLRDGRLEIPIGTLFAGQSRELLVRARVDAGREGAADLARVELTFLPTQDPASVTRQQSSLRFAVTHDASLVAESAQPRVQAMLASFQAAQVELAASALLNEGRSEEASAQLQAAERDLEIAAAAAPASPAREKLKEQVGKIRRHRQAASRARSPGEARSVALEAHDSAYGAMGY